MTKKALNNYLSKHYLRLPRSWLVTISSLLLISLLLATTQTNNNKEVHTNNKSIKNQMKRKNLPNIIRSIPIYRLD